MLPAPGITLILLTLNGGAALTRTLEAIFQQDLAHPDAPGPLSRPEVLVIDSGSTDGTLDTLGRYPLRLRQISPQAFGHGRTRNLAAEMAQGEWLVFLSQDATPAGPAWLARLTRHLHAPEVAASFGRQLAPPGLDPVHQFFLEHTYPPRAFRHAPTQPGTATSIQRIFFSNVNSAIKKAVWASCPFPPDLIMSEDQAFARAALAAGHTLIYDPEAAVIHGHRYSLAQLFRRQFDSGYSLRGIAGDSWGNVARLGLDYVSTELRFLARRRDFAYMPYAVLYELVRSAGFATGRLGHRLPAWLRPRLSLHRRYWENRHA